MSDFQAGDHVELIEDATDLSWGGRILPAGTQGRLGRMYRVQDDLEMWAVWLDQPVAGKRLLGVTHLQVRKL